MTQSYLLGIDIGTQSTRAALMSLDGRVAASASTPQEMFTPRPGWAEQDPEYWWQTTIQNIRRIFEADEFSPAQVIAIGVSGQMHGTVPIAQDG